MAQKIPKSKLLPGDPGWLKLSATKQIRNLERLKRKKGLTEEQQSILEHLQLKKQIANSSNSNQVSLRPKPTTNAGERGRRLQASMLKARRSSRSIIDQGSSRLYDPEEFAVDDTWGEVITKFNAATTPSPIELNHKLGDISNEQFVQGVRRLVDETKNEIPGATLAIDYVSSDINKYSKLVVVTADRHDERHSDKDHADRISVAEQNGLFLTKLIKKYPTDATLAEGCSKGFYEEEQYKDLQGKDIRDILKTHDNFSMQEALMASTANKPPFIWTEGSMHSLVMNASIAMLFTRIALNDMQPENEPDIRLYINTLGAAIHRINSKGQIEINKNAKKVYEYIVSEYAKEAGCKLKYVPVPINPDLKLLVPNCKGLHGAGTRAWDKHHRLLESKELSAVKCASKFINKGSYSPMIYGGAHRESFDSIYEENGIKPTNKHRDQGLYEKLEVEGIGVIGVRAFDHKADCVAQIQEIGELIKKLARKDPAQAQSFVDGIADSLVTSSYEHAIENLKARI